jgi:hypothetical protein
VVVVFEDVARLFHQIAGTGVGDLQQVCEHVHGADLSLVDKGEQQAVDVVE